MELELTDLEAGWKKRGNKGARLPKDFTMSLIMDNIGGNELFGIPTHKDEIWIYHVAKDSWTRKQQKVFQGNKYYRTVSRYGDTIIITYTTSATIAAYSMSNEEVLLQAIRRFDNSFRVEHNHLFQIPWNKGDFDRALAAVAKGKTRQWYYLQYDKPEEGFKKLPNEKVVPGNKIN